MGNPTTRAILRSLSLIDLQGTCKKDPGRVNNSSRQGTTHLLFFAKKLLYRDHTMYNLYTLSEEYNVANIMAEMCPESYRCSFPHHLH